VRWGSNPRSRRRSCQSAGRLSGFLIPWKAADTDIPILKQAEAELAKRGLSRSAYVGWRSKSMEKLKV
jgi:hypothetical protein